VVVILKGGKDRNKPIHIRDYSLFMGRADLKVKNYRHIKLRGREARSGTQKLSFVIYKIQNNGKMQ
jgi:hypothetical protein